VNGEIITLHKKGDTLNCDNYRGITLLSVPGKVLAHIILQRVRAPIMQVLRENQAGFLPGRSCADHIHNLRCILQESQEFNSPLALCFVDYEKAFDSPHRPTLWKILEAYGVPLKLVELIKALHLNSECRIRIDDVVTDWFGVTTGVRQGCVLAPFLFIILMDFILRKSIPPDRGIPISSSQKLCDLEYADDAVLIDDSVGGLQVFIDRLNRYSTCMGLKINIGKTHVLCNASCLDAQSTLTLSGQVIERVESFKYLGVYVTENGSIQKDLGVRLGLAGAAFNSMKAVWRSDIYSVKTKCRLYNACITPILLYGCESWHLTRAQNGRLLSFENRCLRRILGVRWFDFVRNTEVRERTQQPLVSTVIRRRRFGWLGHILRMSSESLNHTCLFYKASGYRRPGRPLLTIRRQFASELRDVDLTWEDAQGLAADRSAWRQFVESICST
jgi:hypothetical protein